jgi:hypothetical protein
MPPTQVNPNDPNVIALSKALAQHESSMNPNAVGDAGTSHGIAQWQSGTWKAEAKDVLGDENAPMSLQNQKAVLQTTVAEWKAQGLNPAQIAAKWNSGSPDGWENKIGTTTINGQQVHYDVPKYVKSVTDLYQQYKGQGGYNPQPFSNPSPGLVDYSGAGEQASAQTKQPISVGSIAQGGLNILNQAEKPFIGLAAAPFQGIARAMGQPDPFATGIGGGKPGVQVDPLAQTAGGIAEQQAGNAAQVGSYFVPGGEGVIPTIAGGAASGLLQGAGNAMSQQQNLTDVATQGGEGALVGGGTAGALAGVGGLLSKGGESLTGEGTKKAVQGLKDAYGSALNLNASERGFESRSGKDLAQVLMDAQAPLGRNANGTLDASLAIPKLEAALTPLNAKANAIVTAPGLNTDSKNFIPLATVQDAVTSAIKNSSIDSLAKETSLKNLDKLFGATRREYGDIVSPQVAEKIKQGLQNTDFKKALTTSDALQSNVTYLASNEMRKSLEQALSGTPAGAEYGALNQQRSALVDAIKRLTKLDGTRLIKGGRLGNTAGGIVGAITGASSGLGSLGALAGDYFGTKAAEFLNNPATKIGIENLKVGASKVPAGLLGKAAKPVGKTLSTGGNILQKSARPAGLITNLIASQSQ